MDFLRSLNLEDLPEQQTRIAKVMESRPDFESSLGFDACAACGANDPTVSCPNCRRIRYCSSACRQADAAPPDDGDEEPALGHSSIICSLLKLCNDDDQVGSGDTEKTLPADRFEAAKDRIQTEYESFPATLANILSEGPCYLSVLTKSMTSLVLHVIGASTDAEFWNASDYDVVFAAYAEALAELADSYRLSTIELFFIGPECPDENVSATKPLKVGDSASVGNVVIRSIQGRYSQEILSSVPKPNIVVFFNPGFTVPDYQWIETLQAIPRSTPFLSTTNTEQEGFADVQFLLDQDSIQSLPDGLADLFGLYSEGDEPEPNMEAFFSVNPHCGSRVRQSTTMANDLYVKNRWILGGIIDSFDPSKGRKIQSTKKQRVMGDANQKQGNPALI